DEENGKDYDYVCTYDYTLEGGSPQTATDTVVVTVCPSGKTCYTVGESCRKCPGFESVLAVMGISGLAVLVQFTKRKK
ncbi:MAG: hypothetical protein ACTSQF_15410, partial [Candidatus Heimdallarchaeaceae archaeon]